MGDFVSFCIVFSVVLFLAQVFLCLRCKKAFLRLIPTIIAVDFSVGLFCMLVADLDNFWTRVFFWAGWFATAFPPLVAVGMAWVIYVIRLMISEIRAQTNRKS